MNPRQIQLCAIDVPALLAEILSKAGCDTSLPIIDGGANVGDAALRFREHFPNAPIHCFEPVSRAYTRLESQLTTLDHIHSHKLALGDENTTTHININNNLWTCSILPASKRGHEFHGDWCQTTDSESVTVTRLDQWANDNNINQLGILKLDLQGYELAALRGSGQLLDKTLAVYAEAQITPEYVGAGTFAEIDLFLRSRGFALYQITDLCLKGTHAEPSCCDGIWLRADILDKARALCTPRAIHNIHDFRSQRMTEALDLAEAHNCSRIAIYGAGAHTAACGMALASTTLDICAIIDDAPQRDHLWGYPIINRAQAAALDLDAIILSSDRAEPALLANAQQSFQDAVSIISLYQTNIVRIESYTQPLQRIPA